MATSMESRHHAVLTVNMEKDKKYAIKIEWIPDGGESYLSANGLAPFPEEQNTFSFSIGSWKTTGLLFYLR